MTTITIDILDDHSAEVISQLKKLGVKVCESKAIFNPGKSKQEYLLKYL